MCFFLICNKSIPFIVIRMTYSYKRSGIIVQLMLQSRSLICLLLPLYYSLLTASANWLNAWCSMERGVPMFKRMKPLPPGPNISPSFNAR